MRAETPPPDAGSARDGQGQQARPTHQVPEDAPESPGALLARGRAAQREGRLESAVDLLGRAIAADPENAEGHWQRASAWLSMGRLDDAIDGFRDAVRLRPDSSAFRNDLGVVLARRG